MTNAVLLLYGDIWPDRRDIGSGRKGSNSIHTDLLGNITINYLRFTDESYCIFTTYPLELKLTITSCLIAKFYLIFT